MIQIRLLNDASWSLTYHMEGVVIYEMMTMDTEYIIKELRLKMALERGLQRGKTLTSHRGKDF